VLVVSFEGGVEEHGKRLVGVVRKMTAAGLKLRKEKCKLGYTRLRVMGHLVSPWEASIDPEKVKAFEGMERPRTGKEVEAVVGFVNFLRGYIPFYTRLMGPIDKLRRKKGVLGEEWGVEQDKAWGRLKKVMGKTPVLSVPDFLLPFGVLVDASQYGVGAVLWQWVDGERKYVAFAAKALRGAQKMYPA
jgi:hypothetical protein